jgi:hypothetical protein
MDKMDKEKKKIFKSGTVTALITGFLLAALAWAGAHIAGIHHFPIKIILAILAFILGIAIGGGMGVWASESTQESGSIALHEKDKK